MEFLDAEGKVIVEIKSRDYGANWHTIEVKEGEAIIGYQEASDTNFLRAIGFMTMKSDFWVTQPTQDLHWAKQKSYKAKNVCPLHPP